jgi:DNA polymerase-3 subunit epsilon
MTTPLSARSILFDTETTGLDPASGDRVIEIAAIELNADLPTGRRFHVLIDPERDIPEEAARVHGFTRADLQGKPRFAEICDDFLAFIGDDPLVAHNAPFDFGFINAELERLAHRPLDPARMVDTLAMAKARFPGLPNSLDALCRRYEIDLSERTTHNALLDCRLLAEVYIELTGGRQRGLSLAVSAETFAVAQYEARPDRTIRHMAVSEAELARHAKFLERVKNPIWLANAAQAAAGPSAPV